jgi:hypothetical protein
MIKGAIYNIMFPLVGLQKAYGWVKDKFVEKISNLPIIGKIFQKLIGSIKDISEGTLADKMESALKGTKEQKSLKPTTLPESKLRQLNSIESEIYKAVSPELMPSHATVTSKDLSARDAARTRSEMERRKAGLNRLGEQLGETYTKGQEKVTAAIVQNTNVIATTHNNISTINNSGRGGGGEASAGSGPGWARDVVICNIR